MKSTFKQITPLLVVFTVLLAGDLISAASLNPPTGAPSTSNNAPEPINVSVDAQTKGGQLNALRYRAISRIMSPEYCDESGANCSDPADIYNLIISGGGGSVDTSTFLNTGATNQTKTGSLTINGNVNSNTYCDQWGGNCSSASSIHNLVNGGGGSIDTSGFLDTSNTNQIKSGDLQVGGLTVMGDRAVYFNSGQTSGDYVRWLTNEGFYGYENGNFKWKLGSDSSINVNNYCDKNGSNCTKPGDLKAAVEAILNDGITMECVSGRYKEDGATSIWDSSLGNSYGFNSVFNGWNNGTGGVDSIQPRISCKNGWTMTGCSAGTDGNGIGDNDESMQNTNRCQGDQVGLNAISARCCRIVIK